MANVLKSNVGLGLDAFLEFASGFYWRKRGRNSAASGRE